MSQASSPQPEGVPPAERTTEVVTTNQPATPPTASTPAPPRRGILRWILVPLVIAGVGFIGYRLGQTGTTSTSQSGFAGGQGGFAGGAAGGGNQAGSRANAGGNAAGGTARAGGAQQAGAAGTDRTGSAGGTRSGSNAGARSSGAGETSARSGSGTRSGRSSGSFGAAGAGIVTPVQASAVKSGTLNTERRLTGTVSAAQTASVAAQTSGTITGILKNVGDTAGAGQTVITLSNKDLTTSLQSAQNTLDTAQAQLASQEAQMDANTASLQQAITTAQASLTNAQSSYDSMQKLYAVGAVAKATLDAQAVQVQSARNSLVTAQTNLSANQRSNAAALTTAKLNVQKAQIALTQAKDNAANASITAPFDGQITAMNVVSGQYVNANTATFTLSSSAQQVKVNVPSTEADSLPVGAAMTFVVGQQKYPLKVTQNAGGGSGSVPITAKFTESPAPQGTVGSVVYTAKVATGILVPSTALQVDGSTTYVFTVENGKAKQHTVTVLGQAGTQSAVSGVPAGAEVVTQPPTGLLDGSSVTTGFGGGRSGAAGAGGPPPGGMP